MASSEASHSLLHHILKDARGRLDRTLGVAMAGEFGDSGDGVGTEYARSVFRAPYAKNIGISQLLSLARPQVGRICLDLLGGTGQLATAALDYVLCDYAQDIVTADIEEAQIRRAKEKGLPALQLDAADLGILRDKALGAIVLAYGIHHIPPFDRSRLAAEAAPKLALQGTLLCYEAVAGTMAERISTLIVDRLGLKPHRYEHPSRCDLFRICSHPLLSAAEASAVFDPQVFLGRTVEDAQELAHRYYIEHYSIKPDVTWPLMVEALNSVLRMPDGDPVTAEMRECCVDLGIASDKVHIGELPDRLRGTFQVISDLNCCVVVPRDGLALTMVRSQE
jgi:hypothetical protein